ncbi:unnamed protein product [Periconia digitata]|uniref:Uncharacterized protein n=1 Tax=Periconia digitata TaxID=1303443 RepID=A0A9W4XQB2_9PLEO|nr:unnamed protein product [Periconia digitata]
MMPLCRSSAHFVIEDADAGSSSGIFQEVFAFLVVGCANCLVVGEKFLLTLVYIVLKSVSIQSISVFCASDVVD